jgi:epsilon-lactone hydrolase
MIKQWVTATGARMGKSSSAVCFAVAVMALVSAMPAFDRESTGGHKETRDAVSSDATVQIPETLLPFSEFASHEEKLAFLESHRYLAKYASMKTPDISEHRRVFAEDISPALKRVAVLYPVTSRPETMAGVYTDVITPKGGVDPANTRRVLINLHGGAFLMGARVESVLESNPVASVGKFKVVAIDYRQGPEYKFPAASQDAVAVYKELLKTYPAKNIGIYGCSAGGFLTAETVALIDKEKLPLPGAIGIYCASAGGWDGGDSGVLALPLIGIPTASDARAPPHPEVSNTPYFSEADFKDPLVAPIRSAELMSRFPPTLIVTSTRDVALSSALYTHTQLTKFGVDAELHVWEGLRHAFFVNDPDAPESKEVWDVVVKFFDKRLGRN